MSDVRSQLKKFRTKCEKCSRKITWLICGIIVLSCLGFLYLFFIKTMNDANVLTKLKNQVAVKVVNMEMWQEINDNIEWKKAVVDKEEMINNPFE